MFNLKLSFIVISLVAAIARPAAAVNLMVCVEDQLYIPYLDKDERKRADGNVVELLRWSAQRIGFNVVLKRQSWGRCLSEIADGKVDAAMAVNYTPARAKLMAFPQGAELSKPPAYLWRFHYPFFVEKGSVFSLEEYRQQGKYGISSPNHYVSYDTLKRQGLLAPYDYTLESGLKMVALGRLDAYVVDSEIGQAALQRLKLADKVEASKEFLLETYGHLAFSRHFYQDHKKQVDSLWQSLALGRAQLFNLPK
ncbi:transporter substrate-binding domain-containing protein [Endozoicomonas sp. G2_1]|uniref:transporter substrate-binding domain-containing protein n=1 Tax=Endozoicomonas sp. G2_1 TaxID=2821091 RepID=UPI001ADA9E14|nr:transporter substrate-binding domain-containing protein [Endozoicomonas sp. G2_1]MBO9491169.1 transporter substrate-binding domain-containing protein [Endozoicomonas sp. G2_1]